MMNKKCTELNKLEGGDKFVIPGEIEDSGSAHSYCKLMHTFTVEAGMGIPDVRKGKVSYIEKGECINAIREDVGAFVAIPHNEKVIRMLK